jgi:hypothetical protein
MCLAIYQPQGIEIPIAHLSNGYQSNPDGAGFSYFDKNDRLVITKAMSWSRFRIAYEEAWDENGHNSPFSIHFRWATHGSKSIENVHPFKVDEYTSLIHNGIIPCVVPNNRMSDTASFVQNYLSKLPPTWYDDDYLFNLVEEYIGASKLVVLTANPAANNCAYIFNERMGKWDDGIWYSNNGYCDTRDKQFVSYKSAFEDEFESSDDELTRCDLCDQKMVYEDVCYGCETCMKCFLEADACACYTQMSLHEMTDSQYVKFSSPV